MILSTKVLDRVPQPDLLNLRLLNRHVNTLVTPLTFSRLVLGYRSDVVKERLTNLRRLNFTRHVRILVVSPLQFPMRSENEHLHIPPFDWGLISALFSD